MDTLILRYIPKGKHTIGKSSYDASHLGSQKVNVAQIGFNVDKKMPDGFVFEPEFDFKISLTDLIFGFDTLSLVFSGRMNMLEEQQLCRQ